MSDALRLLGLAARAGQIVSGGDLCEKETRAGKIALLLIDESASGKTLDRFTSLSAAKSVPLRKTGAGALGAAIGKENRMIVAVRKGPLANQIMTLLR